MCSELTFISSFITSGSLKNCENPSNPISFWWRTNFGQEKRCWTENKYLFDLLHAQDEHCHAFGFTQVHLIGFSETIGSVIKIYTILLSNLTCLPAAMDIKRF